MKNKHEQLSFEEEHPEADNGPVVCLGMTFKNDDERREYFRNELRKKLPELKKIEGFPIGEDEDIIELSDPPYYTACPNPWVNDIIEEWEKEKKENYYRDPHGEYQREPFVSDVSEGKRNPIYSAHSYHTKVPHRAIMRYLLHYTEPGDIVLDAFAGTGMVGVAANLCGNENELLSLGYNIEDNKVIDKESGVFYKKGKRNVVMNDLSPIATNIAYGYNLKPNLKNLTKTFNNIISKLEKEHGWMYKTHYQGKDVSVNYLVWSDTFICPTCNNESSFWDLAVDEKKGRVETEFDCIHCSSRLTKRQMEKTFESKYDRINQSTSKTLKKVPVKVNFTVNGNHIEKKLESFDLDIIKEIEELDFKYWVPNYLFPEGEKTQEFLRNGIKNLHQVYFKRSLIVLSHYNYLVDKMANNNDEKIILRNILTGSMLGLTLLQRYRPNSTFPNMILSGTLYIGSINREWNAIEWLTGKFNGVIRAKELISSGFRTNMNVITGSATKLNIEDNSIDYIFTDPPFGQNLMYSELNFIWESWLKVKTNNSDEAIVSRAQDKNISDYQKLMELSFGEYFRVLKDNGWITVEFSNSRASIWNAIQEALQRSGFIIANVSAIDKKQGSFNAITSTTAVKQDLVISAYKPKKETVEIIRKQINTTESAWTFVDQHLLKLPVFRGQKGKAEIISERTPRILFDRMVAYHVQSGLTVPISSAEFQREVSQRFPSRDGMIFHESQVAEYDKERILVKEFSQMNLFVSDENSAIEWLRQQLMKKPQTRQELHPNFMKEIQHIANHELLPELDDLLHQNFLIYEDDEKVPRQIISYLRRNYKDLRGLDPDSDKVKEKAKNRWYVPDPNKQADLEQLRERALLREFEGYLEELESHRRQLSKFRTEAIRAGFKKAYSERNFEQIVQVGDRLPKRIIEADDKLLMYYDNASIRLDL